MLIDTKQLVSLTTLRSAIGNYASQAKAGNIFYLTQKGKIIAVLAPVRVISDNNSRENFFQKMDVLREKFSKLKFTDNRDSTKVIREMRDNNGR